MPRNVRNFWITLDVDGKKTRVETGPRSRDGGFNMTILTRTNGAIGDNRTVIYGRLLSSGLLRLAIRTGDEDIYERIVKP